MTSWFQDIFSEDKKPRHRDSKAEKLRHWDSKTRKPRHGVPVEFWPLCLLIHIPGDYLVTLFSSGRFIREENPSYWFLKSGKNIIAIFTKSTYSVPASTKLSLIWSDIETCFTEGQKVRSGAKAVRRVRLFMFNLIILLYSDLAR